MSNIIALPFKSQAKLFSKEARELLKDAGFEIVENQTGKTLERDTLCDMVQNAFGIVAGAETYDADILSAAKNLKVIVRFGVGINNLDLKKMRELGIKVGVIINYNAVAEYTLTLILNVLKNAVQYDASIRNGRWERFQMYELGGRTVGLLGFGRIGRRLAELLSGFGVRIVAYDPHMDIEAARKRNVVPDDMNGVLEKADILSLHLPLTSQTTHLLNGEAFEKMKKGAFLVNTSRGEIIDDAALCRALANGRLAGAGLDVFAQEPIAMESQLLKLPNVVLSPHVSALSQETNTRGSLICARSIISVSKGGNVEYPLC